MTLFSFIKASNVVRGILHLNGAKKLYCKLTLLKRYFAQRATSFSSFIIQLSSFGEKAEKIRI